MKLTPQKLRSLIRETISESYESNLNEEIQGRESVSGQPHWTIAENPNLKWAKVGDKFFVAKPSPLQGGVRIVMSSDGRYEDTDFPIYNNNELKALIRFLSELQLTGGSTGSDADFPEDL